MINISTFTTGLLFCFSTGLSALAVDSPFTSYEQSLPVEERVQNDIYIIGPGDILELKLFDAPELSG